LVCALNSSSQPFVTPPTQDNPQPQPLKPRNPRQPPPLNPTPTRQPQPPRARLAKLLRFHTSKSPSATTSLDAYISRMPKDQKQIYWLSAASQAEAAKSPFLERLVKKVGGWGLMGLGLMGVDSGVYFGCAVPVCGTGVVQFVAL